MQNTLETKSHLNMQTSPTFKEIQNSDKTINVGFTLIRNYLFLSIV